MEDLKRRIGELVGEASATMAGDRVFDDVTANRIVEDLWKLVEKERKCVEQLRTQLDGITVVALGHIAPEQIAHQGTYGWSPAYEDVLRLRRDHDRWVLRLRELEGRIRHAGETLTGAFSVPEIDEIRRARGLEPLSLEMFNAE
jgi:hypothetical protein